MAKETVVRAHVDPELKDNVDRILKPLGLTTSQAITLFLKQIEMRKGLPFVVESPNPETLKTFKDTDRDQNLQRFENMEGLFSDLDL